MAQDIIDDLIAGTYSDPDGGSALHVDTKAVAIEKSLKGMMADLVRPLSLGQRLAVVSDVTTHPIMGAEVERALGSIAEIMSVVLPEHPHADSETVEKIRAETRTADALIAVGSGTINDLCKYASALDKKPYAVFGTAPSMNGYTSLNAAITVGGLKKSLAAQAPRGAFFDLSILTKAPIRMIRSGLGDSLCRPTAQADWLLTHLLFDYPYRKMPFVLLAKDEPHLFSAAGALVKGDMATMERLVRTLLLSGFGTAICGNSLPASQAEHLISHYVDMTFDASAYPTFHGEQIGVTTLAIARLQEKMLAGPAPLIQEDKTTEADLIKKFGAKLGPSCWKEFAQKRITKEKADLLNQRLRDQWEKIKSVIASVIIPVATLEKTLKEAGAPLTTEDLRWPRTIYEDAILHAREIRNRYTFLDLAADSHQLAKLIPGMM